jgi:UDP-N-acetylglucosamine 4,6-dehydratase
MTLTSRFLTDAGPGSSALKFLHGKRILVTGGTGSFGKAFVNRMIDLVPFERLVIFSRDELKQYEIEQSLGSQAARLRFFLGDVRDLQRLEMAMRDIDYVIHAAALKQVPAAEYNPFECIHTNVLGAENVVRAALRNQVKRVIALSTDKASNPINLYGASKLASDKIFVAANHLSGSTKVRFSVVRYGNVMGSRGSVIPFFLSLPEGADLPITDTRMTRFMISLEQGVELVWHAFEDAVGGEIYVKKIPSMNIVDIAKAVRPDLNRVEVGIRPGEKLHEQMIGVEDAAHTFEFDEHYKIIPAIHNWSKDPVRIKSGRVVPEGFSYTSDNNADWMSPEALTGWIAANRDKVGKF